MNGVFDTRAGTGYDDDITTRYHFPNQYLTAARACLGNWILYREPRRGGRSGYVATARVVTVEPDPARPDHSYARVKDYLPFDQVVPLVGPAGPYEALLQGILPLRRGVAWRYGASRCVNFHPSIWSGRQGRPG